MKPDLEYYLNFCAWGGGTFGGKTFKAGGYDFMEVRGATQRGWAFVDAYWKATDKECGLDSVIDDDGEERPESLQIMLGDFDRFKRQVSLAGVTMTERSTHWDDDQEAA